MVFSRYPAVNSINSEELAELSEVLIFTSRPFAPFAPVQRRRGAQQNCQPEL